MADYPRWAAPVTLSLSLAGLAVASYLTYVHYTEPTALSCPDTGVVNCVKVTTSSQSMIGPVPVALLGALFFVGMTMLSLPPAWRARSRWMSRLRLTAAVTGVVAALYLVGVELISIRAICAWCTAVHLLAFGLLIACLYAVSEEQPLR